MARRFPAAVFLLASTLGAHAQDRKASPPPGAEVAVNALLALAPGDEAGFDEQADALLAFGPDALTVLDAVTPPLDADSKFRLRRIRDMLVWPLHVRGVTASRVRDEHQARNSGIPQDAIITAVDGAPIRGTDHFDERIEAAAAAGATAVVLDLRVDGRPVQRRLEGLRSGYAFEDYPNDLAEYIHQGHRGRAWDDAVKEGLLQAARREHEAAHGRLLAALDQGCRDALVLEQAMRSAMEDRESEAALRAWRTWEGKMIAPSYRAARRRNVLLAAGQALLECGDPDAVRHLQETEKACTDAGDARRAALARCWRALAVQARDPAGAEALLGPAISTLDGLGEDTRGWRQRHLRLLKAREAWDAFDTAAVTAARGDAEAEAAHHMMLLPRLAGAVPIPTRCLFSSDEAVQRGLGDGLSAQYFAGPNFTGPSISRVDPMIDFRWKDGSPDPRVRDRFTARWTGKVRADVSEPHTFVTRTDDGVRLWVDGRLVIDRWTDQAETEWMATVPMEAGRFYDLKMEYFENAGEATAVLLWSSPSFAETDRLLGHPACQPIPGRFLFSSEAALSRREGDGLAATYFDDMELRHEVVRRTDPVLVFDWGDGSPVPGVPSDRFSVRWTGKIRPDHTDRYTFITRTDDGVRLRVDGKLLVDRWLNQPPTQVAATIPLEGGKAYDLTMEYFENSGGATASLSWITPTLAAAVAPHWTLVYRNTFDASASSWVVDAADPYDIENWQKDSESTLRLDFTGAHGGHFLWAYYGPVRVEADVRLTGERRKTWYSMASVNAWLTHARRTEVGACIARPRVFMTYLHFDTLAWGFYDPWLDTRRSLRLAVEARDGRVESRVDGRPMDVQYVPRDWFGRVGFRLQNTTAEFDNFEIYVPGEGPPDNDAIRACYDEAGAAYRRGDLAGALAALERAAARQPRVDELGRLYAAFVQGRNRESLQNRPLFAGRVAAADHPRVLEMLAAADLHQSLMLLDAEKTDHAFYVHRTAHERMAASPDHIGLLVATGNAGALAVCAESAAVRLGRGEIGFEEAERAHLRAVESAPDNVGHLWRLIRLYRGVGREDAAKPHVEALLRHAPRASFLQSGDPR